jgi:hypothetical protein
VNIAIAQEMLIQTVLPIFIPNAPWTKKRERFIGRTLDYG